MNRDEIREAVIEKYIKPTDRPGKHRVGLEFELPVVNLSGEAVDFDVVHQAIDAFDAHFRFTDALRDDDGHIYSASHPENGDNISCDCSYNTVEFSFGVDRSLRDTHKRFLDYYTFIQNFFKEKNYTLTGMGINPGYKVNHNIPIPNGRYRMLLHHLESYRKYTDLKKFHDIPEFGLMSCASQIQLDAEKEHLVEALNTFTMLEPLKALLFANSAFAEYTCARDYFWRGSLHGLNPLNVDMLNVHLHSIDDLVDYICSESIYCIERGDKYINFRPTVVTDYFQRDEMTGEYFDHEAGEYRNIVFRPELSDISHLRSFKFDDPTYRGTIEFRSVCEQPVSEIMAAGAFQTGLAEELSEVTEYFSLRCPLYRCDREPVDYRRLFVRKEFIKKLDELKDNDVVEIPYSGPDTFTKGDLKQALKDLLAISEQGLKSRGLGEEVYLTPLYDRADTITSPAKELLAGLDNGKDMKYYIEKFAGK